MLPRRRRSLWLYGSASWLTPCSLLRDVNTHDRCLDCSSTSYIIKTYYFYLSHWSSRLVRRVPKNVPPKCPDQLSISKRRGEPARRPSLSFKMVIEVLPPLE